MSDHAVCPFHASWLWLADIILIILSCSWIDFQDQVLSDDLLQCPPFIASAPPPPLLLVSFALLLVLLILSSCPAIAPPSPSPRLVLACITGLSDRILCRCFTESLKGLQETYIACQK